MPEGILVVFSDGVAKKDAAYHDWYETYLPQMLEIPGVASGQRYTFSTFQIDNRPMNQYLTLFQISDIEAAKNGISERYGTRLGVELQRLGDGVDQLTMSTTFFEPASEFVVGPAAPKIPVEQQHMIIQVISVPLPSRDNFPPAYIAERLTKYPNFPSVISGQLFKKSQFQIQNTLYPFVGIYPVADGKEALKDWPVPPTNWKSLNAARETDPALRPGGCLEGVQTRDFYFEAYVKPEPAPAPPPKPAAAAKTDH